MLLGCAIGAFFAGRLADLYGRKTLLVIAAVFFIISAWGSGISMSSNEFIFYRILGGLAVGAASVMAPAYISEVASAVIEVYLLAFNKWQLFLDCLWHLFLITFLLKPQVFPLPCYGWIWKLGVGCFGLN